MSVRDFQAPSCPKLLRAAPSCSELSQVEVELGVFKPADLKWFEEKFSEFNKWFECLKPGGLPTPFKMGQPAGFKDSNHLLNSENFSSNHFQSGGLNTPTLGLKASGKSDPLIGFLVNEYKYGQMSILSGASFIFISVLYVLVYMCVAIKQMGSITSCRILKWEYCDNTV